MDCPLLLSFFALLDISFESNNQISAIIFVSNFYAREFLNSKECQNKEPKYGLL